MDMENGSGFCRLRVSGAEIGNDTALGVSDAPLHMGFFPKLLLSSRSPDSQRSGRAFSATVALGEATAFFDKPVLDQKFLGFAVLDQCADEVTNHARLFPAPRVSIGVRFRLGHG